MDMRLRLYSLGLVATQLSCAVYILAPEPMARRPVLNGIQMLSLLFGLWAIISMRLRNFRVLPEPRRNAVLVTRGPYRWVRHPMYTALLVYTLAQTIDAAVLTNWIAWGVLLIDLVLKLRYEERELLNRFPDYGEYRKRTKKLAPGVW